jgi:hypothetical protein
MKLHDINNLTCLTTKYFPTRHQRYFPQPVFSLEVTEKEILRYGENLNLNCDSHKSLPILVITPNS